MLTKCNLLKFLFSLKVWYIPWEFGRITLFALSLWSLIIIYRSFYNVNAWRNKYLGSGALSVKMLHVMIVDNNTIDVYLGQVRLSKDLHCPVGRKDIRIEPCSVIAPGRDWNRKKTQPQIISNNLRSSIKPENAPDPIFRISSG